MDSGKEGFALKEKARTFNKAVSINIHIMNIFKQRSCLLKQQLFDQWEITV